jgi:hypothetical protein
MGHAIADHPISLIVPLSAKRPLTEIAAVSPPSRINIIIEFVLAECLRTHFKRTYKPEQTVTTSPADRVCALHEICTGFEFWPDIAFALIFVVSELAISFLKIRPLRSEFLSSLLLAFLDLIERTGHCHSATLVLDAHPAADFCHASVAHFIGD